MVYAVRPNKTFLRADLKEGFQRVLNRSKWIRSVLTVVLRSGLILGVFLSLFAGSPSKTYSRGIRREPFRILRLRGGVRDGVGRNVRVGRRSESNGREQMATDLRKIWPDSVDFPHQSQAQLKHFEREAQLTESDTAILNHPTTEEDGEVHIVKTESSLDANDILTASDDDPKNSQPQSIANHYFNLDPNAATTHLNFNPKLDTTRTLSHPQGASEGFRNATQVEMDKREAYRLFPEMNSTRKRYKNGAGEGNRDDSGDGLDGRIFEKSREFELLGLFPRGHGVNETRPPTPDRLDRDGPVPVLWGPFGENGVDSDRASDSEMDANRIRKPVGATAELPDSEGSPVNAIPEDLDPVKHPQTYEAKLREIEDELREMRKDKLEYEDLTPKDLNIAAMQILNSRMQLADMRKSLKAKALNGSGECVDWRRFHFAAPEQLFSNLSSNNCRTKAGTNQIGYIDGHVSSARFHYPSDVAVDTSGNIFVADKWNHVIRKISQTYNEVTTYAGCGLVGEKDGIYYKATFHFPSTLTLDRQGNLYVGERWNHRVRKISYLGMVSTIEATSFASDGNDTTHTTATTTTKTPFVSAYNQPRFYPNVAVCIRETYGDLLIGDINHHKLVEMSGSLNDSKVLVGHWDYGYVDGSGSHARLNSPCGLFIDEYLDDLYFTDMRNHVVRKVSLGDSWASGRVNNVVSTVCGSGSHGHRDGLWSQAKLWNPVTYSQPLVKNHTYKT
ncbi:hypothetical protein AAMO2058_001210600 [Amorphochlora amoebiformis]